MGFHKRYISNEQVINVYKASGINGIKSLYTRGVDALILECGMTRGVASEIDLILSSNTLTSEEKWKHVENEILTHNPLRL